MNVEYNVLLLGEKGAGKSTFLYACDVYLKYDTLSDAQDSEQYKDRAADRLGEFGYDSDQDQDVDEELSGTQRINVHKFVYQKNSFNFIDTPSFGDTRGCLADSENAKMIVQFVQNKFQNLHAVCLILKSDEGRQDVFLRYNIKQMLSLLHKDMLGNVILVFTHSNGGKFGFGSAYSVFRKVLGDVRETIMLKNTFFIDNMCLMRLLDEIDVGDCDDMCTDCWSHTREYYLGLFESIRALKPQSVDKVAHVSILKMVLEDLCFRELPQIKRNIHRRQTQLQEIETIIIESQECIEKIISVLDDHAKVRACSGHFYYLICQNSNCQESAIYGKNRKACSVNCSAWVKSWHSIFDASNRCEMCGCSNYEHESIYRPLLEERGRCDDELIASLLKAASRNVAVATEREDKVLKQFDRDTKERDEIQNDIKNYADLLRDSCPVPYNVECIEMIKKEMEIRQGTSKRGLENYLKEYEQLYEICMHNFYYLLG